MSGQVQTQVKVSPVVKPVIRAAQGGLLQRKCACGGTPGVDGECEGCREKHLSLQRKASTPSAPASPPVVPPIVHEVLRSPGTPLDGSTRSFMEPRFGHDFSNVRVHTDARAAESAQAVNALAYTVGRDVVFGTGQYAPRTSEGRRLMAHELTHVVQQSNMSQPSQLTIGSTNKLEQKANLAAGHLQVGRRILPLSTGTPQSVQRAETTTNQPETDDAGNKEDESLGVFDSSIADIVASELMGSTQWHFLREIMRGFIGEVRGEIRKGKDQELIARFRELMGSARLMWEYTKGYLKGIAKGFWQSITGIWDMLKLVPKAIKGAIDWLFNGPPLSETLMIQGQKLLTMLEKLEEKAIKAAIAFLEDPIKGIQNLKSMIDKVTAQAMGQARKMGHSVAQSIFAFLSKPWGEMGEEIGKIVGMILFEVVLALLTEGIGTVLSKIGSVLAKGGRWLLTEGIRLLKWVGEAFGELVGALKKLGKTLLGPIEDLVEALSSVIEEVIGFFKSAALEEEGALAGGGKVRIPPESKNIHLSEGLKEGGGSGRKLTTKVEDLKPPKEHPSRVTTKNVSESGQGAPNKLPEDLPEEAERRLDEIEKSSDKSPQELVEDTKGGSNPTFHVDDVVGTAMKRLKQKGLSGGLSPSEYGTRLHSEISQIILEQTGDVPTGWLVTTEKHLKDFVKIAPENLNLTVEQYLAKYGLEDRYAAFSKEFLETPINKLKPDLIVRGPDGSTLVWDITSKLDPSHFGKTQFYAMVIGQESGGIFRVAETFWRVFKDI